MSNLKFKVGQTVKIVSKTSCCWNDKEMDESIGKKGQIINIGYGHLYHVLPKGYQRPWYYEEKDLRSEKIRLG